MHPLTELSASASQAPLVATMRFASFSAALNAVTEQAAHTPLAYEHADHEHAAVGSRKRITVGDDDEESG